jgi:hypothetical protein
MRQRVLRLSRYLFSSIAFSLAGLLYVVLALAFYIVFFDPRQRTPDADYYMLLLGVFGCGFAFLVTLSVASRANQAVYFPILARLPSRIEYLAAVLLASLSFTLVVQGGMAVLAVVANGPDLTPAQVATLAPVWLSADILLIVLAMHASDLVTRGWSRATVFGALAILLYAQTGASAVGSLLSRMVNFVGNSLLQARLVNLGSIAFQAGDWLGESMPALLQRLFGLVFWPLRTLAEAINQGTLRTPQALAPAVVLLYATVLFLLAAEFFANKDLHLTE